MAAMAHSCAHCQKFALAQPSLAHTEDFRDWVAGISTDVEIAVSASSAGCAFFRYCLSYHPANRSNDRQERLVDVPFLRVSMLQGKVHDSTMPCKFVTMHWESEARIKCSCKDYVPYATLSYCWGDPRVRKEIFLTHETRNAWLAGLPFDEFPKTLPDAVITTRNIGLRFL